MQLKFRHLVLILSLLAVKMQAQTPVPRYGKLKLVGLQLSSECGTPVQLRGVSTHGPQWFENCYTTSSVTSIAKDWKADVYRIAMYVEEGGYVNDPAKWKAWIDNMVNVTETLGVYCIIDWHVLADGDPNARITEAKDFWDYMSKKHAGKKHVIYEICNEPNERYKYGASANEKDVNWPRIKQYAETIIPIIRKNDPETVIIVGTPYWSNRPWRVVGNPLTGTNAYNTMYTYHFYAGTQQHVTNFDTVKTILNKIPIFATEWGISEESGTGTLGLTAAQNFTDALNGNNPAGIKVSHCIWSFADKDETSALLKVGSCGSGTWTNRSPAGDKAYSIINTPKRDSSTCYADPKIVTQPQNIVVKTGAKATFTVVASGDKLVYLWQKSADGVTWADIQNSNAASYNINAVAASDKAYYRVKVSNYLGYLYSQKVSLILYANGPYFGLPVNIPGRVEAENYDIGGNNVSYYDNSTGNSGNATYRTGDDVDIETTTDSLGGYSIGYWVANEWLDFSVNVLATASYDFYFRIGSANNSTKFQILLDGVSLIAQVNVPNIGNWTSYNTVSTKGINLTKGTHKLRILALADGFNVNYIEVKGPKIDCNGDLNGTAAIDACGNCAGGNTGLTPKVTGDKCYVVTGSETEEERVDNLHIYPNPFHDKLFIQSLQPVHVELFDMNGQKVVEIDTTTTSEISIPSALPSGIYLVKISTVGRVEVRKLVKK